MKPYVFSLLLLAERVSLALVFFLLQVTFKSNGPTAVPVTHVPSRSITVVKCIASSSHLVQPNDQSSMFRAAKKTLMVERDRFLPDLTEHSSQSDSE